MAVCSHMMSLLFVISMNSLWLSNARTFYVGGDDGWTLKPSENYGHWAERNRFLIHDSIVFKYKKGNDSVLIVNRNGYYECNKDNPFQIFRDGNSTFKFDKSGPFYFISGHDQNCEKGQKFIIVVLSENHRNTTAPPSPPSFSPSPSPTHAPPRSHTPSPSPHEKLVPTQAPAHIQSPSPSPTAKIATQAPQIEPPSLMPNNSPSQSPTLTHAPQHSSSPSAETPSHFPAKPPSPQANPVPTPSPTHLSSPSPSPAHAPSIKPNQKAPTPSPNVNSPENTLHHAPAPAPSIAPRVDAPFVLLLGYSFMLSTLISFI